jgi:hypothetical protein
MSDVPFTRPTILAAVAFLRLGLEDEITSSTTLGVS